MMVIVANPRQFKIPDWFLNRQKDVKDGRFSQVTSSALDTKLRDDLERLKKIRCPCWPVCHVRAHSAARTGCGDWLTACLSAPVAVRRVPLVACVGRVPSVSRIVP